MGPRKLALPCDVTVLMLFPALPSPPRWLTYKALLSLVLTGEKQLVYFQCEEKCKSALTLVF